MWGSQMAILLSSLCRYLLLFIIKVWKNVKTPESQEEKCHQLQVAVPVDT